MSRRRRAQARGVLVVALALAGALLSTGSPERGRAAVSPATHVTVGHSVLGRAIGAVRIGDATSPHKVVIVGCIHGDECSGVAIVRALARVGSRAGADVWLIESANPDGRARHTRQNARGVDLNRNFPFRWRAEGRPGSTYYSGPRALSEPESRALRLLILRLRPALTVWYHQHLDLVDLPYGAGARLARRYARLSGLRATRIPTPPGAATAWQQHVLRATSAFVVELPAGALSRVAVRRHAAALLAIAAP